MPKISDAEIAGVARNAGVDAANLPIAVAVALAESGGNTTAHNAVPPDNSYGLWQINMLGQMGPDRRRQFGLSSNDALYDPAVNAKAMFAISGSGKNWHPWTTYTSGKYRVYLARGNAAAGNASAGTTEPIANTDSSFSGIKKGFETLTESRTWVRVGLFVIGLILVIIGLFKLTGDNKLSDTTKAAAKLAIKVAK